MIIGYLSLYVTGGVSVGFISGSSIGFLGTSVGERNGAVLQLLDEELFPLCSKIGTRVDISNTSPIRV